MPDYVARFTFTLKTPIRTSAASLPEIRVNPGAGHLTAVILRPLIDQGMIRQLGFGMTYSGSDLWIITWQGQEPEQGVFVGDRAGRCFEPAWDAARLVAPLLYDLAARTLQTSIYWDLFDALPKHVSDFTWTLPNGREVPRGYGDYPWRAYLDLGDDRPLDSSDWGAMQSLLNGTGSPAPLWRVLLAEASKRLKIREHHIITVTGKAFFDVGHAPANHSNRRTDKKGYAAWEIHPVRALHIDQ